jgi:ketosteroid isomerase-like protein
MFIDTTKQSEQVLAHHLQALVGGDLEGVLSDYTEDSIMFSPQGLFRGLAGIRSFFETTIKNNPPDLLKAIQLIRQDVDGEIAYIVWKAEPYIKIGTDTFVIRNGKIAVQTFIFA